MEKKALILVFCSMFLLITLFTSNVILSYVSFFLTVSGYIYVLTSESIETQNLIKDIVEKFEKMTEEQLETLVKVSKESKEEIKTEIVTDLIEIMKGK